ncbi:MAG: class II fructose-bisphosphate aldolase [Phycisphaerales bacterium]|nr:MAG: class II fructose-bisphosphate aldolase [Phycisphaerales bacterium]
MLLNALQARSLYEFAYREKFAVLAINADSPAGIHDCLLAAKQVECPVIIETSLWQLEGISFGAGDALRGMRRYIADTAILANSDEFQSVPAIFHTDHIKGPKTREILGSAVTGLAVALNDVVLKLSPSSISLDASELSADQNIEFMNYLISLSKQSGRPVTLEMEAGVDSGLTSEDEVRRLVEGVEGKNPGYLYIFAPGLGSRHGHSADGYGEFSPDAVARNVKIIAACAGREIGIGLHGSSGLTDEQLRMAVLNGIIKVNWATDSLVSRSQFASEYYRENAERLQVSNKAFKVTAMDNGVNAYVSQHYVPVVAKRMRLLGGEGKNRGFWEYSASSGERRQDDSS